MGGELQIYNGPGFTSWLGAGLPLELVFYYGTVMRGSTGLNGWSHFSGCISNYYGTFPFPS